MAARIGSYLHSDTVSPAKGGAMVRVSFATDFACRTDEAARFAAQAARWAYAMPQAADWPALVEAWHEAGLDIEAARAQLSATLREPVEVDGLVRLLAQPAN